MQQENEETSGTPLDEVQSPMLSGRNIQSPEPLRLPPELRLMRRDGQTAQMAMSTCKLLGLPPKADTGEPCQRQSSLGRLLHLDFPHPSHPET